MSSTITEVSSLLQLNDILSKSPNKLTVIDFHATWCGPCRVIAPVFASLSQEKRNVNFVKCDVDKARDVATEYNIRAMPTFVFLRGKVKVDELQGANPTALRAAVEQYSVDSPGGTTPFSGKGQTLGGTSAPAAPGIGVDGVFNLTPQAKVLLGLLGAYLLLWYFS